jgi:hypothetical protein
MTAGRSRAFELSARNDQRFSPERRNLFERHAESSRPLRFFLGLRRRETSPFYESNGGRCGDFECRRRNYGELGARFESKRRFVFSQKRIGRRFVFARARFGLPGERKGKVLTTRDEIFLRGLHNVENVLASLAAV